MAAVTIAIVEDHPLARAGMQAVCGSVADWSVVWSGDSIEDLLTRPESPQVVILDLDLHGRLVSVQDVEHLRVRGSRVLVVSALASPDLVRSLLRAGVTGFASKHEPTEVLIEAIAAAAAGELWTSTELAAMVERDPERPVLSEREQRALSLYASGLKLQSVARIMGVKPSTVKEYIQRVRAKYEEVGRAAPTKVHLARVAEQDGYLERE